MASYMTVLGLTIHVPNAINLVCEFINISSTDVNIIMNEKNNLCSYRDESNSYTSITLALIQQELPQYIQNMLKATGYEKLQTIAEINVDLGSKLNDADGMLDSIK